LPKNLPALLRLNALGLQMGAGARRRRRQIVNHFSVKFGNDLKIRRAGFDRARTPPGTASLADGVLAFHRVRNRFRRTGLSQRATRAVAARMQWSDR